MKMPTSTSMNLDDVASFIFQGNSADEVDISGKSKRFELIYGLIPSYSVRITKRPI